MTQKTISRGLWIPEPTMVAAGISFNNLLIDASGEIAGFVLRAPKTGTISKVGFLTGAVTTGDTVDVRLETVGATTGDPTGTLLGTNSNASQVIANGDDNTWFLTTLTTGPSVTQGDLFAVVIANGAAPGNMNIRVIDYSRLSFPYADLFTSSWAKNDRAPVLALEYSDGSYDVATGVYPIKTLATKSYGNTSSPDEHGLKFQLPFPVRVSAMWFLGDLDGDVDIVLYDSSDTVLETVTLDQDAQANTFLEKMLIAFDGVQTLTKDTVYRLILKPTSTGNARLRFFTIDAAAIMDSFSGGQNFHHTQRVDAGAWTDITTQRPIMGIICDGFDDGAGVLSLVTAPYSPAER